MHVSCTSSGVLDLYREVRADSVYAKYGCEVRARSSIYVRVGRGRLLLCSRSQSFSLGADWGTLLISL